MERIEAARRLLAEADGEAIDRLPPPSARVVGAASAPGSIFIDEQVPLTPRAHSPTELIARTFAGEHPTPQAGSYLGTPIEVGGQRVGVLCVYDEAPFEWTPHDLDTLRELAQTVAAELERRALASALETSSVRLDLGFAAANIGSFDWDMQTNALHWDQRLNAIFGYADDFVPHFDSFITRVHPDDRARVEFLLAQAIERGDYEADYRVVLPDGEVRWVAARGRVLRDDEGRPVRMLGAGYDVTATRSAAERLG